ncbi:hypothetical protein [Pseudoneobacillus sp. C159]
MKEKIEMIVRKVVMDYFNKEKNSPKHKQVLVILDQQPAMDADVIWKKLKSISSHFNTTILVTEKWTKVPDDINFVKQIPLNEDHLVDIGAEMVRADVLLYATANHSTLAKLAMTMDDSLSLWITIQMQFDGKPIILAKDFLQKSGTKLITTPFSVSKRIDTYISQLRDDKVQLLPLANVSKWLDSYFDSFTDKRHVVLVKHIEAAASLGKSELVVPKNSLITPMCKDFARELGVKISQKE